MRVSRGTLITFTLWFAVSNMMSKPHRSTSNLIHADNDKGIFSGVDIGFVGRLGGSRFLLLRAFRQGGGLPSKAGVFKT